MTVLVTGATGTVGREVVRALLGRGVQVRALTRDPASAHLDPRVQVVAGDLTDPASCDAALAGVVAAHLITFTRARGGAGDAPLTEVRPLLDLVASHGVARLTVLHGGGDTPLQDAVQAGPVPWTLLQPVEFMANALDWAETVRSGADVVEPFVDRVSAVVHEADIGDVAAAALVEDGHAGRSHVITGPEVLTVRARLDALADALGRPVGLRALDEDEAVARWRAEGYDEESVEFFRTVLGNTPEVGRTVTDTVPRVTGHPARTFAQWAREHVDAFR